MISRSLHFGANYVGTSAELSGCVNDAEDWFATAQRYGYLPEIHREPTKATLLGALTDAVGRLRYRDRLFVTYSGHGTWVPDRDGDEADGRDEALVPVDYRTAGVVLDDDLLKVWDLIPFGARVIFVSDSCHSGSVSRFANLDIPERDIYFAAAPSKIPHVAPARFLPPTELGLHEVSTLKRVERIPARGLSRPSRVALLSGCRDDEVSFDAHIDGRARGAASWAYLTALDVEARTKGKAPTLQRWHEVASDLLAGSPYKAQHPQRVASAWQSKIWTL